MRRASDLELLPVGQVGLCLPGHAVTVVRVDAGLVQWIAACTCGRAGTGTLLSAALVIEHDVYSREQLLADLTAGVA